MTPRGSILAAPLAFLVFFLSMVPALAILIRAVPPARLALPAISHDGVVRAAMILALALPMGICGGLGVWQAQAAARRLVLALALAALLVPHGLIEAGIAHGQTGFAAMLCNAAQSASLALLVLTAFLNTINPGMARTAAASGASMLQGWRLVLLPNLYRPLLAACATGIAAVSLRGL